jgi:hypothetical protein
MNRAAIGNFQHALSLLMRKVTIDCQLTIKYVNHAVPVFTINAVPRVLAAVLNTNGD